MNRVREAMSRLASRATEYAGETFEFHRPGLQPATVSGWRASLLSDAGTGDVPIPVKDSDLCFKTSEFSKVAGGLPKRGDTFVDDAGVVYEVVMFDRDRCWRPIDSYTESIRVHTQIYGEGVTSA